MTFAVGNPKEVPSPRPCSTTPVTQRQRPRRPAAASTRPARTRHRVRVAVMASPSASRRSSPQTSKPSALPSATRTSTVPAPAAPSRKSDPTTTASTSRTARRASPMKERWSRVARAAVKSKATTASTSSARSPRERSSQVRSLERPCGSPRTSAGSGLKVTAARRQPRQRASSWARRSSSWWPRWRPSKAPMAQTQRPARSSWPAAGTMEPVARPPATQKGTGRPEAHRVTGSDPCARRQAPPRESGASGAMSMSSRSSIS